ncbi:putative seryl-tRNA synthetase [Gilbertella persicaria]|uniref:serine--tRNA ligase n=1 Tax=Rhizopus stolonifer TaxID=4846 RepID=A0A367JHK5_RHIST|nr:putative seryl-tRNA synthetase [Gilbertella persicaria]KAI8080094.1 putative seryl-tRNA synthetase [Gilbertella persicaria]RCH89407.1 seryl-tRNA synthetase [Rhizopus stolonifer]
MLKRIARGLCVRRSYTTTKNAFQIQPKLDYNYLAENATTIQQNMINRKYEKMDMDAFVKLNKTRLELYNKLIVLRAKRNDLSLATRAAAKKSQEERNACIEEGKQVKLDIKACEEQLNQTESHLLRQGLMIPNDTHSASPIGSEDNARVIKVVGEQRSSEGLRDHVQLATELDILDIEQAAITSGSSFYYLQGMGAFLELALIQYAMHKAATRGFFGVLTPDIVRTNIAYGCGFQPRRGESSQIYNIATKPDHESTLCLAGTAEIPLAGKFATQLLNEHELPKKLVGFGHAFRTEAGGRGVETKGLYRVHQFSKVELFALTTPEQSEAMMEEIRSLQEEIFTDLGLCFRVLDMPTEELGASAFRKYDMEAWMPGRGKWGEISSTSNCTDYQSRRLSIRYRPKHQTKKNTQFCHTLNGTAIAVPRVIIAILETFQTKDGSVQIPKVLQKWLPGEPAYLTPSKEQH